MTFIKSLFNILPLTLAILLALPWTSQATMVEGIVLSEQGPVAGAQVTAFADYLSLADQRHGQTSTFGDKPGQFRLDLEPGIYYFIAEGADQQHQYFTYHGLNPITVKDQYQWVPFFAMPSQAARCEEGFQGVGGQVLYRQQPLNSGSISVYPLEEEPFRGMGLLTNTISSEGEYWFDLEPGNYVLVARKRQNQTGVGPIGPGDLFCFSSANPVEIKPANSCEVNLHCYPRNDIKEFLNQDAADPRGRRENKRRSASLEDIAALESKRIKNTIPKQPATLEGVVTDLKGNPMEGLFVSAFPADDLNLFQMYIVRFKTAAMAKTDSGGRYKLDLEGGPYYLVARERIGEAPMPGEFYGIYEGTVNHSLLVAPGTKRLDGNIIVEAIMP